MPLDLNESEIATWLSARSGEMQDLLAAIVNTDSNSHDRPGVGRVIGLIVDFLSRQGIAVETVTREGDVATLTARSGPGGRGFLLLGHCDTVFPSGEAGRRPFRVESGRAYGPGIADMKGGVVVNAFVLSVLHAVRPDIPIVALFTGDEEIASPFCRPIIEAHAREARAVFNAEPARPSGNIVTGRKGALFLRLEAVGVAAHSGANFTEGRSAIETIAQAIIRLHALTELDAGITVNVGLVQGGISVNTTAPHAACEIDIRYRTPEQRDRILSSVERIAEEPHVPGTTSKLTLNGEFLPLVPSPEQQRLVAAYLEAAHDLSLDVGTESSGGCADSGFTSAVGTATLCGLGPIGRYPHTLEEFIEIETLPQRVTALAITLTRLFG